MIPEQVFKIKGLEVLSLIDNQIAFLDRGIVELSKLRKLFLRNNGITELPIELGYLEQLEVLDLSDNQLKKLPSNISNLRRLKMVYLQNNRLSKSEKKKISNIFRDTIIYF